MRARERSGRAVSNRDRAWLERYKIAREAFAEKRKRPRARPLNCREEAVRFVLAIVDAFGIPREEIELESSYPRREWIVEAEERGDMKAARVMKRGLYKLARASARWSDELPYDVVRAVFFDLPIDNPKGRNMNIRFHLSGSYNDWISAIALTDEWDNVGADLRAEIHDLIERPYLEDYADDMGIDGVSVQVSDPRR